MTDVTTALTLVIDPKYHDKINEIRSKYDKSFPRWFPHINYVFPFAPEEKFDELTELLQNKLKDFPSFDLHLNEIGFFQQKQKIVTVHTKPSDDSKLQDLNKAINEVLPKEYQSTRDHFAAHLTLAQYQRDDYEKKYKKELNEWLGEGFKFTVSEIYIIKRYGKDDPFTARSILNETIYKNYLKLCNY